MNYFSEVEGEIFNVQMLKEGVRRKGRTTMKKHEDIRDGNPNVEFRWKENYIDALM